MANIGETAATIAREDQQESYENEFAKANDPAAKQSETATTNTEGDGPQTKPDVSNENVSDLLPKLFEYFHNNREELARALGVHRSTVDRWMNGTSRPNNSTLLRMRRIAQERNIQ